MRKKNPRVPPRRSASYKRRLRFELFERRDLMAAAFMNDLDSLDVDQDQTVSPLDVLNIVNDINRGGSRSLVGEVRPSGAPFVDVDGDKSLSPLDALSVINAINRGRSVGLSRVLQDEAGFANDEFIRIGTGQPLGSRFYELKIDANLAPSTSTIGDLFAVYVVDSNVPSQTLLNRGITSSPIFTLTAQSTETTPGLTTFDGQILTIDLSSIATDTAQLKLQLLNHDTSKVSSVKATPIANTVDPERVPSTQQNFPRSLVEVGPTANPATLTPALDATVNVSEVQWTSANRYEADVALVNKGTAIGRDTVVLLKGLPPSVTVENASGSTAAGVPYLNFRTAIAAGGLGRNESSYSVRLKINNPNNVPFSITPEVLTGSVNRAPTLPPIADLTVMPGGKLSVKLAGQDPDGDTIRYSINSDSVMPTTRLAGDELLFSPTPAQIGNYQFKVTASDGALSVSQTVRLAVTADSNTTTRLSGKILDVSGAPIVGVRVEVGNQQALTQSDGSFLLNFGNALPTGDTLRVRAELVANSRYPFIAEKLGLLLEHDIYAGYNNQILRPVYLPVLNAGTTINPAVNQTITQQLVPNEAPAAVTVRAGTLFTQQGTPFTGALSITEVPPERTPISLPSNIAADLVVTIQPGEMTFSVPTPITLPNRGKYAPGSDMDIWSINPTNGEFEIVGKGKVSDDGTKIETVSGGIRFSSWHAASPPPTINPEDETKPPQCEGPRPCPTEAASEVAVYSGTYIEEHTVPSYSSLGVDRSLSLVYNSSRAKSSQIIRFNTDLPTWADRTGRHGINGDYVGINISLGHNGVRTEVPGSDPTDTLNSDKYQTKIPLGNIGTANRVSAGVSLDMTDAPDGQYFYGANVAVYSGSASNQRLVTFAGSITFSGGSNRPLSLGSFIKVSSEGSTYGTGWGIAGLQRLLITKNFEGQENGIVVVDGGGVETYFEKSTSGGYTSPVGDYSVLSKKADGTFERRMKDGMVYAFDDKRRLATTTDRNGNQTHYAYDNQNRLVSVIDPVGLTTSLQYSGGGLSSITLPDGRKTFFTVNSQGDLEQIVDPDGSIRSFGYDDDHRLIEEITPLGFTEKTEYDNFSRVRKVTKADGSIMQFSPAELQGVLDTSVQKVLFNSLPATAEKSTRVVTTSGNVITNRVNRTGQIISTKDNLGTRGTYEYNDKLQLTKTTDSRGTSFEMAQDVLGNVISTTESVSSPHTVFDVQQTIPTDGLAFPGRITMGLEGTQRIGTGEATGDGKDDVIVVGYNIVTNVVPFIATFPGDGQGGFLEPILTAFSGNLSSSTVGDLNGDGRVDLTMIVDVNNRREIRFFINDGTGRFAAGQPIDVNDLAIQNGADLAVSLGDMDGDGKLDAFVYKGLTNQIGIIRNQGGGVFQRVANVSAKYPIKSLQATDLNADRFSDIVVASESPGPGTLEILTGNGQGSFFQSQEILLTGARPVFAAADFSGDGRADLAIGYEQFNSFSGSTIELYIGSGNVTFSLSQSVPARRFSRILTPIDLGGNGSIDLAIESSLGNEVGGITVVKNSGGRFEAPQETRIGVSSHQQLSGDFNSDGLADIVRPTVGFQVITQTSLGSFDSAWQIPLRFSGGAIVSGDFNGDGFVDLSTESGSQNLRLLGNGNGQFSDPIIGDQISFGHFEVGDFDGDEKDDIVSPGSFEIKILYSNADGGVGNVQTLSNDVSVFDLVVNDFNEDGLDDFAFTGRKLSVGYAVVSVYLKRQDGTFSRQVLQQETGTAKFLIKGDFDGDGDTDLFFDGDGSISTTIFDRRILWNNGAGAFTSGDAIQNLATIGKITAMSAFDGDRDGLYDLGIVIGDKFFNYRNKGASTFELIQQANFSGWGANNAEAADLNGDGFIDFVTADGAQVNGRTISVLPGKSDGTFGSHVAFDSNVRIFYFAVADLNSDGRLEIVGSSASESAPRGLVFLGLIEPQSDKQNLIQKFSYGSFSQLSSMTDELGRETRFQLDPANGNLLGIQRPLGYGESMTYTSRGLLDTHLDALGRVTDYDYDLRGRVISIVSAKGTADETTVLFGYDPIGNVTSITDPKGNVTQFGYDSMRRVTSETDALGGITIYTYDKKGNVTSVMDAKSRTTLFDYDALSRMTSSTDPLGNVTRFGYDIRGNQVSVTDPNGNVTRKVYDVANRLIRTIDPDGGITKFTYDRNDNLLSVTDPNANVTRYFYDERKRVVRELDPLGKSSYFLYDGVNNLIARKDRNDRQTYFTYDALDRMTKERWQGTKAGQFVNTITSSYDIGGNLKSTEDNYSKLAFTYDSLDRVKSVGNAGTPNAASVSLSYAYDDNSNRTSVTDVINGVNGATVVSQFDELDRLKQMTQTGASTSTKRVDFAFNAIGQYTSIARSNNVDGSLPVATTSFSYDVSNRLSLMDHKGTTGTSFASFGFGYDSASRITRITEKNQTIDYGYDKRDQLVSTNYGDAARNDEAFKFDANGNRVGSNAHGTAYRTGPGNRLTTDGVYNYAYDAEGNLTKRTEIATGSTREFQWDHRNRLTMLSDKNASGVLQQVVRYSYDSLGRRISKQVDTTPLDSVDAAIEQYVYDGEDVILDFVDPDGSGPAASQQTTRYLRGPGIDNLLAIESASGTNWVLQDHLGSTRALVSSAGVLVQSIDYDSFGKAIVAGSPLTRYLYTGRELDAESGLFYYRARYYDSSTGRFTNEDPIGFDGGSWNTQIYVDNSPISAIDPMGLLWDTVLDFGFIFYDLYRLGKDNVFGDCDNLGDNLGALGMDALGALLPFVTGLGQAKRAEKLLESEDGAAKSLYEQLPANSSRYDNRATDVSKKDFEKNLLNSGYNRSTSKDGKVTVLEKDGAKYVLRDNAKSTGGPTADYYKPGSRTPDTKIRLERNGK